jgi:hypothetical protein
MAQLLLNAATATGAGTAWKPRDVPATNTYIVHSFQAVGSTTNAAGATVVLVQVSDDGVNYLTLGTITLTLGTSATTDGFSVITDWNFYRGYVSSISGTGANVSLYMKG